MTTKILTVRIAAPAYSDLCASASQLGVLVAAHVRRPIGQEHRAEQISQLHHELLAKLEQCASLVAQPGSTSLDEILLLCRATTAHLNRN